MENIKFKLNPSSNLPANISHDAISYWFNAGNFTLLMKLLFKDRQFNTGEFLDFENLNSTWLGDIYGNSPFTRDISKDFENIMIITRKTYSAYAHYSGNVSILTYELDFPNY